MKNAAHFLAAALMLSACGQAITTPVPASKLSGQTTAAPGSAALRITLIPSSYIQSLEIAVAADGSVFQNGAVRYHDSTWVTTQPWVDPGCNAWENGIPRQWGILCPWGAENDVAVSSAGVAYWPFNYQVVGSMKIDTLLQIGANGNTPKTFGVDGGGGDMLFDRYDRLWVSGLDFSGSSFIDVINFKTRNEKYLKIPDYITALTLGPDGTMWGAGLRPLAPARLSGGPGASIAIVDRLTNLTLAKSYTVNSNDIQGIATGSDGALWFTDAGNNSIDRMTVEGKIAMYPLPTSNAKPGKILAASDGALWFTETATNRIGRISTSGQISEYAVAAPSPYGIAQAPKCWHCPIWFSYSGGLGRIDLGSGG